MDTRNSSKKFDAADIRYFNPYFPMYPHGLGALVNIGKDVFICDVYIFIDKARDAAIIYGEELLYINLSSYLRGYV
jgi:hypothetical protein